MTDIGVWCSVLSLFAMSLAPLFNKMASTHLSWFWGAALSSVFCFAIAGAARPREFIALFKTRKCLSKSLLLIALTNSLGLLCQYGAVAVLEPATLSILGRMYVVFAILLAQIVLRERCSTTESIVLVAVLAGAALFCWTPDFKTSALGLCLCLAYCFLFALTHLQVKLETSRRSPNQILLANNLVSALVLIPVAFFFAGPIPASAASAVTLIAAAAFFGQWLGLLLFFESLRRIPMVKANLIRSFSPIVGVAVTYPFFPVHLAPIQIAGGGVMIAALVTQSAVKALHLKGAPIKI